MSQTRNLGCLLSRVCLILFFENGYQEQFLKTKKKLFSSLESVFFVLSVFHDTEPTIFFLF